MLFRGDLTAWLVRELDIDEGFDIGDVGFVAYL
jgi:hypothetical protein